MFTGIITETSEVTAAKVSGKGLATTFKKPKGWDDLALGESVNTNGVCLTVATIGKGSYSCHLMPETLNKSTFGKQIPAIVNLERALKASDRLGGHFVQGHVDNIGQISKIDKAEGWTVYIKFGQQFQNLVVYKGSITVNGVSLTVSSVKETVLGVALVPYTLEQTTLGTLKTGDSINLEFDILGKYIAANMKGDNRAKS